jgi:subtilisin family serine protease
VLVACATEPVQEEASVEPIYQVSQPDVPWTDQIKPRRGGLPKRPKLDASRVAVDSFVNVVIELHREPPFPPEDATAQDSDGRPGAYGAPPNLDSAVKELEAELLADLPTGSDNRVACGVSHIGHFISATVRISKLDELKQKPWIAFVHHSDPLKLDLPESKRAKPPKPYNIPLSALHHGGKGVLVGIIDVGGFDFSHEDFLDEQCNTRFLRIWDQGGKRHGPPKGFDYGAELTQQDLNAALHDGSLPATLLESQSQQRPGAHGTHVASIAAGKHGVCPNADLAAVLLDVPTPEDDVARRRATFSDSSRIIHAVSYLLDLATELKKPVVINISLGTNGGSHDGANGVSRWLDAALAGPGRVICVAVGNAGQEEPQNDSDLGWIQGRIHTAGIVPARDLEVDIGWTVMGNGIEDVSENELEIWYGAQDEFTVSVKPPRSGGWITVKPREYLENKRLSSGTTLSIYNELYYPTNGSNYIAIHLSPNLDPRHYRGVESGVWTVRLSGKEIRDGRFDAWIERDDPGELGLDATNRLLRFPSFFSKKSTVDSHSINSLACGFRVVAVANLDELGERVHVTSSQGPTRDGRCKPEIAAPGTNVVAASGFTSEQKWISMTGTSMASPFVTGVVGLMLAANHNMTAAQCTGILQATARPLPGGSYKWTNDIGFGRINPEAAIQAASDIDTRTRLRS